MNAFSQSYRKMYDKDVNEAMSDKSLQPLERIVTLDDLKSLPKPVRKYLIFTGAVGKPITYNAQVKWTGEFRTGLDKPFTKVAAEQFNTYTDTKRMYYMKMKVSGITACGYHFYNFGHASMKIRIAGLFKVADAKGFEMDKGETVTVFNDLCLLYPSALLMADIKWEEMDSLRVKAYYTCGSNQITAVLYFDKEGRLINFISNDRYMSSDGKTYKNFPWSTPVKDYKETNGRMVVSSGEAVWHLPEQDYCYGKLSLLDINYNVKN